VFYICILNTPPLPPSFLSLCTNEQGKDNPSEMTGAQRIAARRAAAMEKSKQSGGAPPAGKARLGYEGGTVAVDIDENLDGAKSKKSSSDNNNNNTSNDKSDYQKKKDEDYQKAKAKYEMQKRDSMKHEGDGNEDDGEMLADAVRFDEDIHRDPFDQPKCKDMFCGVIFLMHLVSIIILAVVRGIPEYIVLLNENGSTGQIEFERSIRGNQPQEGGVGGDDSLTNKLSEFNGFEYVGETDMDAEKHGGAVSTLSASILTLAVSGALSMMAAFLLFELVKR
jgi:hypothetical protein